MNINDWRFRNIIERIRDFIELQDILNLALTCKTQHSLLGKERIATLHCKIANYYMSYELKMYNNSAMMLKIPFSGDRLRFYFSYHLTNKIVIQKQCVTIGPFKSVTLTLPRALGSKKRVDSILNAKDETKSQLMIQLEGIALMISRIGGENLGVIFLSETTIKYLSAC